LADLYVDGAWVDARTATGARSAARRTGRPVATVSEGRRVDAERAVAAARHAFDDGPWPRTPEPERGAVLRRVADLLLRDKKDYAQAESLDTGKRLVESEYDVEDVARCFAYYAGIAGSDAGGVVDTVRVDAVSTVVHEPVGVCGLITPWKYPLPQASWKVAPALLAGNTFVLKPSELTPSTSILLMRTLEEAGVPAGVANLVLGTGPEVGAVLSEHPDVDLVSFTGGSATGRAVMAAAARTVKNVAQELGGKNPNVQMRVARRLRHGTVWVNDYHPYVPQAEWGGFKQSGVGREPGRAGLDEYRETKHIWQNVRPAPQHWFGA